METHTTGTGPGGEANGGRSVGGDRRIDPAGLHGRYQGPKNAFYDAETHGPMEFELRRVTPTDWRVLRRFGYHHDQYDEPFVCPADVADYSTDLASTPWIFQWVVPARGRLFPAIMLHDALVADHGADGSARKTHLGPDVTREDADAIMRDAMGSLGVGLIRRWLAWTGASVGTAWDGLAPKWWWRLLVVLTFGGIGILGILATLDLLDIANWLPWMGERTTTAELALGAAFAVVIPLAISVLWWRRWRVGLIGGLTLALLLHITLAMVAAFVLYQVGERLLSGWRRDADEIEADQARLAAQVRNTNQMGKGSATLVDLRIPTDAVTISVTGPGMLVQGLRLVTDLAILDGHDHHGLHALAANLQAIAHCGATGSTPAAVAVERTRQGSALVIGVGPTNMYESELELRTTDGATFEQALRATIGRHTGRGFIAGLVPVAASGHTEHAEHTEHAKHGSAGEAGSHAANHDAAGSPHASHAPPPSELDDAAELELDHAQP